MVVWLVLAGLLGVLIILGWWGAMTATTALTLAMTNAVQQTMMTILACTLLAMMPLLLFGAFKLGEGRRTEDEGRMHPSLVTRSGHSSSVIGHAKRSSVVRHAKRSLVTRSGHSSDVSTIRIAPAPRRLSAQAGTRARVQAMRIAQRWFR